MKKREEDEREEGGVFSTSSILQLPLELDLDFPDHGVSITTTCVIGNVDTDSAKDITRGHMNALARSPAADCALAIVSVSTCIVIARGPAISLPCL